jgi:hypothetical protein
LRVLAREGIADPVSHNLNLSKPSWCVGGLSE